MIDIGANLTHEAFLSDFAQVLNRAVEAGVGGMIVTGTDPEHSRKALNLAREQRNLLRATAGIHPHHAQQCDVTVLTQIAEAIREPEVVAVGECGLDFYRDFSPRPRQLSCFEAQLELATEFQKPVFLHQRDAHETFLEIVTRHRAGLNGGVAHCFTGSTEELAAYLDLDLYIGVTGWVCDERRGLALRESVRRIPQTRLLIETDAPYLLPRDLTPRPKSRRNEPAMLAHVCAVVASLRGEDATAVANYTAANARRLFQLPEDVFRSG